MRKFRMLIFTLVMVLLTTISYAYENYNINTPEYKQPSFNINSSRFGEIKNISWLENFTGNMLLILSSKNNSTLSCLYSLNVDTGESKLIYEVPSHKVLNDVILYDDPFSSNDVITTFDKGIIKTKIFMDENKKFTYNYEFLTIDAFDTATSMDFKGNLYFAKPNDSFIYIKQLYRQPFAFFNNQGSIPDTTKHYKKPFSIVAANNFYSNLTYTSLKKDGLHLYSMNYNGTPLSKFNKPIIKNIVSTEDMGRYGYGYIGMNLEDSSSKEALNVFMIRNFNENAENTHNLDTIPFNLDKFGGVPALDVITFNEDYSLVYTSYNNKGKGELKIANYNKDPKVIVTDDNLFGPVRISERFYDNGRMKLILYFTYENSRVHAKICDIEGKLVKDITDMIK